MHPKLEYQTFFVGVQERREVYNYALQADDGPSLVYVALFLALQIQL